MIYVNYFIKITLLILLHLLGIPYLMNIIYQYLDQITYTHCFIEYLLIVDGRFKNIVLKTIYKYNNFSSFG